VPAFFILILGILSVPVVGADLCRVLVVVGMEDERAIAAGADVDVVVGTANANVLRERLANVNVADISAVYSFGVAGGLDPALKPGDLLISTQVCAQNTDATQHVVAESWIADQDLLGAIQEQAAKVATVMIRNGVFLGTDFEARDNPQTNNHSLRDMSGADIIDNESHIAARFASAHKLPFVSVRAVSDSVNHKLPPAALIALQDDGSPNVAAVVRSILKNPRQIPALIRTARDYKKALDSLKAFRRDIGFMQLQARPCGG
jgi:adenosylhomocysteine nucleosidase